MLMQIITKNMWWQALMDFYKDAKFDHPLNRQSWDKVLMERRPEQKKEKD